MNSIQMSEQDVDSTSRVAVITGGASGIGLAIAKECILKGMHVVLADNAAEMLREQVEQLRPLTKTEVLGVVCDVTKPDSVEYLASETFNTFHRVDWLFNNAGISSHFAPVWALEMPHIRHVMDVNLYGVIYSLHAFLPRMFEQSHRSHVINISSMYGLFSGSQVSAYAMSKHALLALSESLYFDLQRLNKPVNVSVACPSFANTSLLSQTQSPQRDSFKSLLNELITRSRPAEDVAQHIVKEVEKNTFYILPDKEVKTYCEERTNAILEQSSPHRHSLEHLMVSLSNRARAKELAE